MVCLTYALFLFLEIDDIPRRFVRSASSSLKTAHSMDTPAGEVRAFFNVVVAEGFIIIKLLICVNCSCLLSN